MRLRALRKLQGLTLSDVAKSVGISAQVLSRYEREERQPDFNCLFLLADYFNVTVDYLLERSDVPNGVVETFSKAEKELIGLFRLLSPFEQEGITLQIKALAKAHASV